MTMSSPSRCDISGLDKGVLLMRLACYAKPQGLGFLHVGVKPTVDQARLDASSSYIDYYHGLPIKSDLRGDYTDPRLYNRDAGPGAFENIVNELRRG